MFENENIDSRQVGLVAAFGVILVIVAVIGLQVLFLRLDKQNLASVSGQRPRDLAQVLTEQQTQLSTTRWVDKQAGVVQIDIGRAMKVTLEDLNAQRR